MKLKRSLTLKRRIETHLAAHDPLATTTPTSAPVKRPQERVQNFTRENLSTSPKNVAVRQTATTRERRSTAPLPSSTPQPIFASSTPSVPSMETFQARPSNRKPSRGRPPVSGVTKNYSPGTVEIDSGGPKDGKGLKGRFRRRSNSFKEGFSGTMRVCKLFSLRFAGLFWFVSETLFCRQYFRQTRLEGRARLTRIGKRSISTIGLELLDNIVPFFSACFVFDSPWISFRFVLRKKLD